MQTRSCPAEPKSPICARRQVSRRTRRSCYWSRARDLGAPPSRMLRLTMFRHTPSVSWISLRALLVTSSLMMVVLTTSEVEAEGTTLNIPIGKVRSGNGALYIGVYTRNNWLRPGGHTTYQKVRAHAGTVRVTFEGLKPGRYGVAAFHDENSNGKVDFNFIGLPSEGYGFSRTTPFGKPSFDDTAFELHDRRDMPIRLKY